MKTLLAIFLVGAASLSNAYLQQNESPYTFVCEEKRCIRRLKNDTQTAVSINVCKLNCDDFGSLWPKPTGQVHIAKELVSLLPSNITLENLSLNPVPIQNMLEKAFEIFKNYISEMHKDKLLRESTYVLQNRLQVQINVTSESADMNMPGLDESYKLQISTTNENTLVLANITAQTFYGARHALETLSQLIAYDEVNAVLQVIRNVSVEDKPVFPYRGIMLDSSRNYLKIEMIKKIIDGMSYNKLSVFHWHITDTHSFPMEVPSRPKMSIYGAYSPDKIYSVEQIKDVVAYARQRGIKVIPEIDQPAHSGYGYQWGVKDNLGNLVVCVENEPWYDFCVEPPCGQLNIVNDNVTEVMGDIFSDMMEIFDKDIFHMGGDEVDFRCYNSTKEITDWMVSNNYSLTTEDFYKLWGSFQETVLQKLLKATNRSDTNVLMWTSGLTHPDRIEQYLDKDRYILQIWSESTDTAIGGVLQKGYRTIFSNVDALYLDCGFQAWLGDGHNWCAPIKGWQTVYDNNPEKIYAKFSNDSVAGEAVKNGLIMGSETPLWAEQVDDNALESRIWPRAAAHAERTWTHPETTYAEAESRMVTNRNRMVTRGIAADQLQPEFCSQNEGKCYAEKPKTEDNNSQSMNTSSFYTIILAIMTVMNFVNN